LLSLAQNVPAGDEGLTALPSADTYTDMLKTAFIRTDSQEPACRGAAMIAAVALGWAKSVEELAPAWIRIEKTFGPAA
jgi:glycerol kinase